MTPKPSTSLADYIFARMVSLYGGTWVREYGDNPRSGPGAEWSATLHGLTRQQIDSGFDELRKSGREFPPSAPRFRAMCMGVPSFARVKLEARDATFSPFTRAVLSVLDTHRFRTASAADADRLLRDAYDVTHESVMAGAALPKAPAGELTHEEPVFVPASKEVAEASLRAVREALRQPQEKTEDETFVDGKTLAAGGP